MSITVTWSASSGGSQLTVPRNQGNLRASLIGTPEEVYLWHNATNDLTNAKFYLTRVADADYAGSFSPQEDLAEVLEWGAATSEEDFGGMLLNMNAVGGYPTWSTFSTKSGTGYNVFRTGTGDSASNGIDLYTGMGLSATGVLPAGSTPDVRFSFRMQTPESESVIGIRHVNIALSFDYTS